MAKDGFPTNFQESATVLSQRGSTFQPKAAPWVGFAQLGENLTRHHHPETGGEMGGGSKAGITTQAARKVARFLGGGAAIGGRIARGLAGKDRRDPEFFGLLSLAVRELIMRA
jgi:hypothetical protein